MVAKGSVPWNKGMVYTEDQKTNMYGHIHSGESLKKMSASHKGYNPTPEARANMSAAHVGLHPTEETRNKLSMANKNRIHTNIARQNMSRGRSEQAAKKALDELFYFDLMQPEMAYFWGFAQTDGHLSGDPRLNGHKGKFTIELNSRDVDVLYKIKSLFDTMIRVGLSERTRKTNFKAISKQSCLTISNQGFREGMKLLGFPQGKKSKSVAPPTCNFSDVDYVRGLIDGDGSVGFASSGHPIISLVTASEHISKYYIKFLFENIGVEKVINRNKRDGVYNITVGREDAVNLSKILYYNGSMTMDRKLNAANKIKDWVRLQTLKSAEDIGRRKKKKVA